MKYDYGRKHSAQRTRYYHGKRYQIRLPLLLPQLFLKRLRRQRIQTFSLKRWIHIPIEFLTELRHHLHFLLLFWIAGGVALFLVEMHELFRLEVVVLAGGENDGGGVCALIVADAAGGGGGGGVGVAEVGALLGGGGDENG